MKKTVLAIMAIAILGLSAPVKAEVDLKGAVEFGPYVGLLFPLEDYNDGDITDPGILGARLGVFLSDNFSLEGSFQRAFSDAASGAELNMDAARLSALFHFGPGNHVRPYLVFGGGWERFDLDGFDAENDWGAHGGLGLRFIASTRASVRVDAKYNTVEIGGPVQNERQHNIETTLGVSWLFGADVGEKEEPIKDSDNDGVVDSADQCPGTAAGITVDGNGCEVKEDEPDSDGDNVVDSADKCPNTPEGAPVDANGCALDSDGDNVPDFQDKCPATEASEKVDEYGCPERVAKARGALEGVTFKLGSAQLTPNAETILNEVAAVLNEFQNFNVEVQGHTDNTGSAAVNMSLSKKRAESVKAYLISQGVDAGRLTANGYGQSSPIADNSTREGRAKNRRVELKWVD